MQIPFFGLKRYYELNRENILNTTNETYKTGQFLKGKEIEKFEKNIANYCRRKFAVTVSSCTDALYFSLIAAGIKRNDQVLVTSYSFISSATSIIRAGAIPVFLDIEDRSFMMNPKEIENKITKDTKAIIVVHLFGQTFPFDIINKIADKYRLIIIEDAAQSLGARWKNQFSGSLGKISCLSFDPTKNIGAFGTGGCMITDDEKIFKQLLMLRNHGKSENGTYMQLGYNSQIASIQAALLDMQLKEIENINGQRKNIAGTYYEKLKNIAQIKLPVISDDNTPTFHKFVIIANNRDDLRKYLKAAGIETMVHYPKILPQHDVFKPYEQDISKYPIALFCAKNSISIPLHPELSETEIDYICDKIINFYQ
ncbi:MAG: DegT/DnrJ/EryC1/StrS family aminotransferase [Bacteroidota bacterium]